MKNLMNDFRTCDHAAASQTVKKISADKPKAGKDKLWQTDPKLQTNTSRAESG